MKDVWDFIWINIRQECQWQGIGRALTNHRVEEVLKADGRAIHLMTESPRFFEYWGFRVLRNYMDEGWKLVSLQLGSVGL
jgi:N-acetylglutamate synthase-like GNAT family acetyltransferase